MYEDMYEDTAVVNIMSNASTPTTMLISALIKTEAHPLKQPYFGVIQTYLFFSLLTHYNIHTYTYRKQRRQTVNENHEYDSRKSDKDADACIQLFDRYICYKALTKQLNLLAVLFKDTAADWFESLASVHKITWIIFELHCCQIANAGST